MTYNNKVFRSKSNSANGEVSEATTFYYHQENDIVWAEYTGGKIKKGFLIAKVLGDNSLDMRYQHINNHGILMTGICHSVPEFLEDGRLILKEKWQWTSGDLSSGESIIEEILN